MKNVIDKTINKIVNHLQFSIDVLPKINELLAFYEKQRLEIVDIIYNPSIDNVSLAIKCKKDILELQKNNIIKYQASTNDFKILLISTNVAIVKFQ